MSLQAGWMKMEENAGGGSLRREQPTEEVKAASDSRSAAMEGEIEAAMV